MFYSALMTEEQAELTALLRDIAETELAPYVAELDQNAEFSMNAFHKLCDAGFYCPQIPEQYGGLGLDTQTICLLHQELGRIDTGFACGYFFNGHSELLFNSSTNEAQKQYVADKMLKERCRMSVCITEPGAGSDAGSMRTTYRREGDEYVINGTKCFISTGSYADLFLVVATKDRSLGTKGVSLFLVERKHGVKSGKHEDKMGLRCSNTAEVIFEDVRIPAENLIGEECKGFKYIMKYLEIVRGTTTAIGLGGAIAAYEYAVKYAKERIQFGQPIMANQGISFKLAEMLTKIHVTQAMVMYGARLYDEGHTLGSFAPATKVFGTDAMVSVINDALQVLGGYGYMKEYPMEKLYRDARIFPIFEGTNEIQKVVIAGLLAR